MMAGKMVYNAELDKDVPEGWENGVLTNIAEITMGQSPSGESYNELGIGEIFYQGRTDFGFRFPEIRIYTNEPKRRAKKGDILMSVRAPVGDLNIANNDCCIGRGIGALSSKIKCNSFLFYLMQEIRAQFNISNDEGTIFGSITKEGLYDIQIIKVPEELIKRFEGIVSKIDNSIGNNCKQVYSLIEIKNFLLSKMSKL
jgi:type I restriction enzyme S subunit